MSPQQGKEPVRGAFVAAEAAQILDDEGIYNILVGNMATGFVGHSHPYPEADFAVEDKQLQKAVDALTSSNSKFQICTKSDCIDLKGDRRGIARELFLREGHSDLDRFSRWHHVPAAHFHHKGIALSLHLRSVVMPWLTEWSFTSGQGITNSDDPRLPPPTGSLEPCLNGPTGPWPNLYPIRIQSPDAYVEGAIYMLALYMDKDLSNSNYLRLMYEEIIYRMKYEFLDPFKPEYYRTLQRKFNWAWLYMNDYGRPQGHDRYALLYRLREDMIIHGELPSDLPRWDHSGVPGYARIDGGWDRSLSMMPIKREID